MKKGKVSAEIFIEAFREQWFYEIKDAKKEIYEKYFHATIWTDFMQRKGGFINKVMDRIVSKTSVQLEYATEWSKVDCLFVGGEDLIGSGLIYPSKIHALVEHENGNDPEVEMWKLLHWRSPLKVIIFYDWSDEDRERSKIKSDWLDREMQLFEKMLSSVCEFHSEDQDTEYLFLVGAHQYEGGEMYWRRASSDSFNPVMFIEPGQ